MRTRRLLAALLLVVAGCSRQQHAWGIPGEVRIGYLGTIYTLNPLIAFGQRLIDLTQLYAQPLVGIGPNDRAIPILCTAVPSVANGGISRDGLTITYHLRQGVRFADGVLFTSRDVAFTYRAILDPRNPVTEAAPYARIASLRATDPDTVVVRLKRRWAGAVDELFAASDYVYGILPEHAFSSTDVVHSAWNEHPFGTGPFRVVRWVRGDSVELVPNPYAHPPPRLRRVIVRMIPDENTAFIALRGHAIDFTDITYDQVAYARADPQIRVVPVPRNEADDLEFQTQSPAMRALRVREAVAYAVDRATIARAVYHGLSPLATTEVPPVFAQHDAQIGAYPYDPAKARALLDGQHPLVRISFNSSENTYSAVATVLQENLAAAGFDAVLHGSTPSVLYAPPGSGVLYDGRFEIEVGGWYGGLDPEASEPWICANRAPNGPNVSRWCDPQYDAAFTLQARSLDPRVRTAAFHTMQRRIHDELPALFLVYRTEYEAINPALHGFAPNMLYNFGQVQDWSLH